MRTADNQELCVDGAKKAEHTVEIEDVMDVDACPPPAESNLEVVGRVHSIETFSTVDGHGIRSIVFLQGCPRRCKFCSNCDTWEIGVGGELMTVAQVIKRISKYIPYYNSSNGGITCSGGEPLVQSEFVSALFQEAHKIGVKTALDTTGYGSPKHWDMVLPHTDLCLFCPKSIIPATYKYLTLNPIRHMLKFAEVLEKRQVPTFCRWVLMPGITNKEEELSALIDWGKKMSCIEAIELLPYHQLGRNKWEEMGMEYPLADMVTPSAAESERVKTLLEDAGFKVML